MALDCNAVSDKLAHPRAAAAVMETTVARIALLETNEPQRSPPTHPLPPSHPPTDLCVCPPPPLQVVRGWRRSCVRSRGTTCTNSGEGDRGWGGGGGGGCPVLQDPAGSSHTCKLQQLQLIG